MIGFKVQQHRGCYYPFDGTGGVLAHALYPPNGQLHFDDDEKWTYKDAEKIRREYTDLLYVAIHEIGHALGVDHLENKNSIMYFSYKEPIDVRGRYIEPTLHQVDIAAIQKIYGKRERAPAPALPTRRPANDEIEIGAADPVNHNGNDRPTDETPKSTSCPVKIDAIVADGSSTLIFDGNTLFILNDQRRVVKQHSINEIFSNPPQQLEAAVLDHRTRKLIFFERGGTLHAYFHSNFFNRYLSAYKRRFDQYHHLTGAISFKSGAILLLDKNYKYATYDSRLGNSSEFKPIDFQNFPRNVRVSFKLDSKVKLWEMID
ncbi:unnamed protein product, partial [Mesorhabditis belari]|uniref:Peptidase metallopeptidase domain-containing protein n=1 Tax=Mesorhabditis belari TaxID=2138241 RepID=A0AAF3F9M4_9BILA